MLAFGVDIPLIEIILVFAIIMFILLVEALVIISLLVKQMNQNKNLSQLLQNLSTTLLEIKKKEIEELDKIRIRKR
jgi:hypothetical protein